MPLVTSKEMLKKAQSEGYAVGAFNVENMEMVMAVIEAAEKKQAPVMLQTTPSTVRYAGVELYAANVKAAAEKASVPVALHLDHGSGFGLAVQAFRAGYTSIMIDGSQLPFEENVGLSKSVADVCSACGIPVEGELGQVGGKEDDLEGGQGSYTDPDKAKEFQDRTGITSLAVAIGTAHGLYKGKPVLDFERLTAIREKTTVPLVLHGASGVPDEDVAETIRRGICKVNYATELRIAYTDGVKALLVEKPDTIDPKAYGLRGKESVMKFVMEKMDVCGCSGKGLR